jgi:hypothetical protein
MFMGPTNIFAQMPLGYFAAPSGAPLMTPELRSPEYFRDEKHCYRCPDGSHRVFRFGDRDAALAMGCEVTNNENCASISPPGGRMGQQAPIQAQPGAPVAATQAGGVSILVEPAVYGVPIVPVLIALGLAALVFSVTKKN